MTIGERIAHKRKELGLSQEALGERMGVSRQAIYKWESDAALPEIEKLVNLSREFSVSVGWLLGEEETPERAELTPEQLRMVEEIVDRYLAARPDPAPTPAEMESPTPSQEQVSVEPVPKEAKRRRWPWVLAALILIGIFLNLFSRLDQMNRNYQNLQSTISSVRSDVNGQINGITRQVETILQSQNSLTAEQNAQAVSIDYAANTVTISARALPRTFTEGMTAEFLLASESETVTVPGELEPDHAFTAQLTGPLSDNITVSVAFLTGSQRETQQLGQFTYLYSNSFPEFWVDSNLSGRSNIVDEYAWVRLYSPSSFTSATWDGFPIPEIAQIRLGLFQDGKLLAWYKPLEEQPSSFHGNWDGCQFFQLEGEWAMEPGPVYTIAAIVTDEYGRERVLCSGCSYVYDAEEQFVNSFDGMDSPDPADWEY